jgi:glutamate dehydrogenase
VRKGAIGLEATATRCSCEMTDDVGALVLEDNRLQTLALSLAERGGADALPAQARVIETLEATGRLDRAVEGLDSAELLARRAAEGRGLTRPELAVILSHGKLALQAAIEKADYAADPLLRPLLHAAFPGEMQADFAAAIDAHRLRGAIIATKMANRVINRMGLVAPFEVAEEEGVALAQVAAAYFAADALFGLEALFAEIETAALPEDGRLRLLAMMARLARLHVSDLIRATGGEAMAGEMTALLADGIARLGTATDQLLRQEARNQAEQLRAYLADTGAAPELVARIVRLGELDGVAGTAALARRLDVDEVAATAAYVRLGEALALDWAQAAASRFTASDPWERLLTAGLARDFEQFRLDFLARQGDGDPAAAVEGWLEAHAPRVAQFRGLVDRARAAPALSAAMLAQVASQARALLSR